MGKDLLIDTNIIIYLLKKDDTLSATLEGHNLFISFITEIELFSFKGLNARDKNMLNAFINWTTVVQSNPQIVRYAVDFRLAYGLKLPDAVVAATAKYLKCNLMTADKKLQSVKEINVAHYEKKIV